MPALKGRRAGRKAAARHARGGRRRRHAPPPLPLRTGCAAGPPGSCASPPWHSCARASCCVAGAARRPGRALWGALAGLPASMLSSAAPFRAPLRSAFGGLRSCDAPVWQGQHGVWGLAGLLRPAGAAIRALNRSDGGARRDGSGLRCGARGHRGGRGARAKRDQGPPVRAALRGGHHDSCAAWQDIPLVPERTVRVTVGVACRGRVLSVAGRRARPSRSCPTLTMGAQDAALAPARGLARAHEEPGRERHAAQGVRPERPHHPRPRRGRPVSVAAGVGQRGSKHALFLL